jgi:hypothetical protein
MKAIHLTWVSGGALTAGLLLAGCGPASQASPGPTVTSKVQSSAPASGLGTAVHKAATAPTHPASTATRTTEAATPHPTYSASSAPATTAAAPAPAYVPPTHSAPTYSAPTSAPTHAASSCYPLTNGGKCYEPGEYCRNGDHGVHGVAGDGEKIACEDNNGWRWEPV